MSQAEETLEKIESGSAVVGVVGLGYVGLPLVLGFVERGFRVIGLDIDEKKVGAVMAGQSYIEHIPGESIGAAISSGKLEATTDFAEAERADALIIPAHHEPQAPTCSLCSLSTNCCGRRKIIGHGDAQRNISDASSLPQH